MFKFNFTVTAILALVFSRAALADGPFGVAMGEDASKYPDCMPMPHDANAYVCKALRKSHPDFGSFLLISPKETGVCKVVAMGHDIDDNGSGDRTREAADKIAQQLVTIYGQWTKKFDFLHAGALFKEDNDWLMALMRQERSYIFDWMPDTMAPTPTGVVSVLLEAHAKSLDRGFVTLDFEFSNFPKCKEILKSAEASAF